MKNLIALLLFIPTLLVNGFAYSQTPDVFVNAKSFGLTAGGTTANGAANKTALQNAINSLGSTTITARGSTGGTVMIPCGFYYIDPGISVDYNQKNITIAGCADGYAYHPLNRTLAKYKGGTVISWAKTGAVGFDLTGLDLITRAPDGNYTKLTNMVIAGAVGLPVSTCIKVSGIFHFSNLAVEGCTDNGIWLYEFVNNSVIDHVSVTNNVVGSGYGLFVGKGGPSFGDNTLFRVSNSVFRANKVGVRIEQAANYEFDHFVIESNTNEGLVLWRRHAPAASIDTWLPGTVGAGHDQNRGGRFVTGNFENNGFASDVISQILVDAQVQSHDVYDTPSYHVFENIVMAGYKTSVSGVWKPNIRINSGQYITFRNSTIGTNDPSLDGPLKSPVILGAKSSYISFYNTSGNPYFKNSGTYNVTNDSYIPGSFSVKLNGCTEATTGTAFYTVNGNVVTLDLPTLSCRGDRGTSKNLTNIPTLIRPSNGKSFVNPMLDKGTWGIGFGSLTAGTITLYKDASGAVWTPGEAFTFKGTSMTYTLN